MVEATLQPNKTLRIGWSGGVSHYEDWHTIREPLNQLLREFKCTLVSVGTHFDGIIDEDNKNRLRYGLGFRLRHIRIV